MMRITEKMDLTGLKASGGVIPNVLLLRSPTRNNRTYTSRAMADFVQLAEGKPVFLDHPNKKQLRDGEIRSVHDLVGSIGSPTIMIGKNEIRGRLHYMQSYAALIESLLATPIRGVALSLNCGVRQTVEKGQTIVHEIGEVYSVDLVSCAAGANSLLESHNSELTDSREIFSYSEELLGKKENYSSYSQELGLTSNSKPDSKPDSNLSYAIELGFIKK